MCAYIDAPIYDYQLVGITPSFAVIKNILDTSAGGSRYNTGNLGNFFFDIGTVIYITNLTGFSNIPITSYKVLRRDGVIFSGIHQGISADRLDISNQMPITAGGVGLYDTNFLVAYQGLITDVSIPTTSGDSYNDHRYMEITDLSSGVQNKYFIYSTSSGIMQSLFDDSFNLGTPSIIFTTESGIPQQIETSNYLYTDQYLFTSVSGSFFQTNLALSGIWNEYKTGLPSGVVITRIRIDDRL